jgi:hypothetical protein
MKYKNIGYRNLVIIPFFVILFITINSMLMNPMNILSITKNIYRGLNQLYYEDILENRLCRLKDYNLTKIDSNKYHLEITEYIKSKNANAKIFSFPYDPIFYLYFKQAPPPFLNAYEGSPRHAQEANINYIKDSKVDFIIYSVSQEIKNYTPEYIRTNRVSRYILEYYYPDKIYGDYIIMIPNKSSNLYFKLNESSNLELSSLKNRLLTTNYGGIFYSEGYYKSKKLLRFGTLIYSGINLNELNNYLKNAYITSDDLFILINIGQTNNEDVNITLKSSNKLETNVSFKGCVNFYCLIKLSNIPIYYKKDTIYEINSKNKVNSIKLVKYNENDQYYW